MNSYQLTQNVRLNHSDSFIKDENSKFKYWEQDFHQQTSKVDSESINANDEFWNSFAQKNIELPSSDTYFRAEELTHVDSKGRAQMVDVSHKSPTTRQATAEAIVVLGAEVFAHVKANNLKKGDVFAVAKLAGIMGAKQTSNLIPLCHPLALTHVKVEMDLNEKNFSVTILATAVTCAPTGVEMEALTGVSVAALTVYDMCKAVSHDIYIQSIRLMSKFGGKKDFVRP